MSEVPSRRRRLVPGSPTRRAATNEPKFQGQPDCRPIVEDIPVVIDLMAELRKALAPKPVEGCNCAPCKVAEQERRALPALEDA